MRRCTARSSALNSRKAEVANSMVYAAPILTFPSRRPNKARLEWGLESEVFLDLRPGHGRLVQALARIFEVDAVFDPFEQIEIGKGYDGRDWLLPAMDNHPLARVSGAVDDIGELATGSTAGDFATSSHVLYVQLVQFVL